MSCSSAHPGNERLLPATRLNLPASPARAVSCVSLRAYLHVRRSESLSGTRPRVIAFCFPPLQVTTGFRGMLYFPTAAGGWRGGRGEPVPNGFEPTTKLVAAPQADCCARAASAPPPTEQVSVASGRRCLLSPLLILTWSRHTARGPGDAGRNSTCGHGPGTPRCVLVPTGTPVPGSYLTHLSRLASCCVFH